MQISRYTCRQHIVAYIIKNKIRSSKSFHPLLDRSPVAAVKTTSAREISESVSLKKREYSKSVQVTTIVIDYSQAHVKKMCITSNVNQQAFFI